ncbi:MotA/TolQ/ExbB proton channel family protein [Treponema sp.]|uniref:MotA/TolQ/ExbB proton channel family protein n=1 Tax=Treponema sp. TaxID=166 RepID=UPI003F012113
MLAILKSGGIIMVPIIACALIAVFIIFERFYYFFSVKKRDRKFNAVIENLILSGDFEGANSACDFAGTPCAKVVKCALEHRNFSEPDLKEFIQVRMDLAVLDFERNLSALGIISNISTLLGLLGTVSGNIRAFGIIGDSGAMGNSALLAGAISESLITTVAGLAVAIPALVFSTCFNSCSRRGIICMEQTVTSMLFALTKKTRSLA